jgi:hypothetical protein
MQRKLCARDFLSFHLDTEDYVGWRQKVANFAYFSAPVRFIP